MCIKPIEIVELQNNLNSVLEIMSNMDNRIAELNNEIRNCDLEVSDLLHKIELSIFNQAQGNNYARQLQTVTKRRRIAKDSLSIMSRANTNFKNMFNENYTSVAKSFVHSIDQQVTAMNGRQYAPRVREDLFA